MQKVDWEVVLTDIHHVHKHTCIYIYIYIYMYIYAYLVFVTAIRLCLHMYVQVCMSTMGLSVLFIKRLTCLWLTVVDIDKW